MSGAARGVASSEVTPARDMGEERKHGGGGAGERSGKSIDRKGFKLFSKEAARPLVALASQRQLHSLAAPRNISSREGKRRRTEACVGGNRDITLEEVTGVADRLVAAGVEPALRAVRDRLGTGATETILQFLREWRRAQERRAVGDLAASRATESRLRGELAHQTQVTSEHCAAMVPLTAERDAAVIDLAKAVLRLEYVPCLETALTDLRADRDREREGRTKAEQEVTALTARVKDLQKQLDEAQARETGLRERLDQAQAKKKLPPRQKTR